MEVKQLAPAFPTGFGSSDTHALKITTKDGEKDNPHLSAGHDYTTLEGKEIAAMVSKPASAPKLDAPWFIGSTYVGCDARSHKVQREKGSYNILPVDIDTDNHDREEIQRATNAVVGNDTAYVIYSSASATEDDRKWRVLIFVSPAVSGEDYKDTQSALFDLYQAEGIKCDRALERTGQLIFLPNVPPDKRGDDGKPLFYQFKLNKGRTLALEGSRIAIRRDFIRTRLEEARQEAEKRSAARRAKRADSDGESPVEAFNAAHDIADLMRRYGYEQEGNSDHWQSPMQTSGSYATRIYDSRAWVSLSGSDRATEIGQQNDHCCWGDAFDLYVHFEHDGDFDEAVRTYGREINPADVEDPASDDLEGDFGPPKTFETTSGVGDPMSNLQPPTTEGADAENIASEQEPVKGKKYLKQWVFLSGDNEFYHVPTGQHMTVTAFNLALGPHTGKVEVITPDGPQKKTFSPAKTLIDHLNGKVVHQTMYRPDQRGDLYVRSEGIEYVNSYRTSTEPKKAETWKEREGWKCCERHIHNILGEYQGEMIIDWMAHNVQYPGVKILWAPIIVGVQGDGKTTIAKMLSAVMGKANVGVVSPETVFSDFTSWAEGSCVKVLEEIRVHGNSRHDAMNKLKPMITNDMIEVVRKGKDGKQVHNVTNYMALSNFMDALALDEGDRRWGVFKTRFEDRKEMLQEFDDAYWEALHGVIREQPDVIRAWLLARPLKHFNRVAGPDISDHKLAMIENTKGPDQFEVEEAIALGAFGVDQDLLATDCLNQAILNNSGVRLNGKRLANALSAAGWVNLSGTLKWRGKNRRLWMRRGSGLGGTEAYKLRQILDGTEGEHDL